MFHQLIADLKRLKDPTKAAFFPRFFKTGKGEYGEGDVFLGVTVPKIREISKRYRLLQRSKIKELLGSPIHEVRLCALCILVLQYEKGDRAQKNQVVDFYLKNLKGVNNWDLVDSSAAQILGKHLLSSGKDIALLEKFAGSDDLWKQRIAIVATHAFIRAGKLEPTFHIARKLLHREHDLIHKAVGWMLREAGKKDWAALEKFLKKHSKKMPRTMLRYAIEKFPEAKRRFYMNKR